MSHAAAHKPGAKLAFLDRLIESGEWARLSLAARAVLPVLLRYAKSDTGECWPSIIRLGIEAGVCHDSAVKAVAELRKAGIVGVRKEGGRNVYRLCRPDASRVEAGKRDLERRVQEAMGRDAARQKGRRAGEGGASVGPVDGHDTGRPSVSAVESVGPVPACPSVSSPASVGPVDGNPLEPVHEPRRTPRESIMGEPGQRGESRGRELRGMKPAHEQVRELRRAEAARAALGASTEAATGTERRAAV